MRRADHAIGVVLLVALLVFGMNAVVATLTTAHPEASHVETRRTSDFALTHVMYCAHDENDLLLVHAKAATDLDLAEGLAALGHALAVQRVLMLGPGTQVENVGDYRDGTTLVGVKSGPLTGSACFAYTVDLRVSQR
jgi:hypothetical protein